MADMSYHNSQALIEENHSYLASLGVSHDSLELIRLKCSTAPYNLSTKLTGAGGGGCTVTLVPDGTYFTASAVISVSHAPFVGYPATQLDALSKELSAANFDPYLTAVGGSGLGILSPYNHGGTNNAPALLTPLTPPETPAEGPVKTPLRDEFANVKTEELSKWAEQRGRWLFV